MLQTVKSFSSKSLQWNSITLNATKQLSRNPQIRPTTRHNRPPRSLGRTFSRTTSAKQSIKPVDHEPACEHLQPITSVCHPPRFHNGLDRVLFNPGVHCLQDLRSSIYNFNPDLENLISHTNFNFDALPAYVTSSKDCNLLDLLAKGAGKYVGSTSSLTGVLSKLHYLISSHRPLNHVNVSRGFGPVNESPLPSQLTPSAIFIHPAANGYAIDADSHIFEPNEMSFIGHIIEKLLTVGNEEFSRYLKDSQCPPASIETDSCQYHFTQYGPIVVRSQLDAYDPRLPGTGVVDIKSRAVASLRYMMDSGPEESKDYEITTMLGNGSSFEREKYDLSRAAMIKYSLQARLGRMAGIFVAYHNITRIFGFEYLSLADMDLILHGQVDSSLGDKELLLSMTLLNAIFDRVTDKFPNQSVWVHFDVFKLGGGKLRVFAQPIDDDIMETISKKSGQDQLQREKTLLGLSDADDGKTASADANHVQFFEEYHMPDWQTGLVLEVRVKNFMGDQEVTRPEISTSANIHFWNMKHEIQEVQSVSAKQEFWNKTCKRILLMPLQTKKRESNVGIKSSPFARTIADLSRAGKLHREERKTPGKPENRLFPISH